MAYVLRFIQQYKPSNRKAFLDIESKFRQFEQRLPDFQLARRSQPVAGREPTHSIIWECEFPSLAHVQNALTTLSSDPTHTQLFEQQSAYITDLRTEILEVLEF